MFPIGNVKLFFNDLNDPYRDVKKMIKKIECFQDGDWIFSLYFSFHPEAAQITYKELEVKRKKMQDFAFSPVPLNLWSPGVFALPGVDNFSPWENIHRWTLFFLPGFDQDILVPGTGIY